MLNAGMNEVIDRPLKRDKVAAKIDEAIKFRDD